MIKLNRVEIQNYRQYKKINLNFESKKGLFLFIGKNGRGKSNFLNAICWCLYGDEPFKEPEDKAIILNDDVSKEGKKYIEIFVKIEIITDDKTYLFHRSIYQNSDGDTQAEAFNVSTRNNDQQDSKIAENPEFIVKKILPKKIRKFFLFDGEAVQKLFEGDYAPNLKESIYEVSDIELLRVSLDHVTATENPISKRAYRDDPKASSLEEKKTELINLVKEKSIEHSKLENSTKELQKNIDRLRVKQEEYRKYKNLFERRTELKNRDKEIRNSINSNREKLNDVIVERSCFFLIRKELIDYANKLSKSEEKGEIPPLIREQLIYELIERGECICGTKITKNSVKGKNLLEQINKIQPQEKLVSLTDDKYLISRLLKSIKNIYIDMSEIKRTISELVTKQESAQRESLEISNKLKNATEDVVGDIEGTVRNFENQLKIDFQNMGGLKSQIGSYKGEEDKLTKELQDINEKKKKRSLDVEMSTFLKKSEEILKNFQDKLIRQIKVLVSQTTNKYFKELIFEKDKFEQIKFNDDYIVKIYRRDSNQRNQIKELSMGEKKMLGLATIKALSVVSGFSSMPAFIDSPLEQLGGNVKKNLLNLLPNFMPDKQVFIFSLDRPELIAFGKDKVNKNNFYLMDKIPNSMSTQIHNYYETI